MQFALTLPATAEYAAKYTKETTAKTTAYVKGMPSAGGRPAHFEIFALKHRKKYRNFQGVVGLFVLECFRAF